MFVRVSLPRPSSTSLSLYCVLQEQMAKKSTSTKQNQKGNSSGNKARGGGNKGKRKATELPPSEPEDEDNDVDGEFWAQNNTRARLSDFSVSWTIAEHDGDGEGGELSNGFSDVPGVSPPNALVFSRHHGERDRTPWPLTEAISTRP